MSRTLWLDRRCFIRIAAGAAAAWPIPMRAEDGAVPTIGFIDPRSSPDPFATQFAAFQRGLKSTGFVEGENLREKTVVILEEVKSGDWAMGGKTLTTADVKRLRASQ